MLPIAAAFLYAAGALSLGAASAAGMGSRRATVICNAVTAVLFLGFLDWGTVPELPSPSLPVVLVALSFLFGQLLTVFSLRLGAVSSVTPVLGIKIILVNILVATLLDQPLAPTVWLAGVLAVAGIALLQADHRPAAPGKHRALALLSAFLAALTFSCFDVLVQHWSPRLGFGRLVPPGILLATVLSLILLLPVGRPRPPLGPRAWRFVGLGALGFGLQAVLFIYAIGAFGDAPGANIAYSSRGLWSVAMVWLLGRVFHNTELSRQPRRILAARATGATLIFSAILLILK